MFTKITILQRISLVLVLAIAFLLVLGSNRLGKRNFDTIQNTVTSVYEDRVVVQDLIYKLSTIFHEKEITYHTRAVVADTNDKIVKQYLIMFENTQLTNKESAVLKQLNASYTKLQKIEAQNSENQESKDIELRHLKDIKQQLHKLAEIQLKESKQLIALSEKSLGMNSLFSKLEFGFLIVIGIAMLALIFTPTKRKDNATNP